jgi:hypothetical protein
VVRQSQRLAIVPSTVATTVTTAASCRLNTNDLVKERLRMKASNQRRDRPSGGKRR